MKTMITGPKLRAIRALRGISQAKLAEDAGVAINAICEFEAGKRDIRASTVAKLCEALGVQVTYTVDGTTISGP
jgi:transcriptional regulator with XRE-family HTH domain